MKVDLVIRFKPLVLENAALEESLLRYFFRGVNKCLSGVNKVFLLVANNITIPQGLNLANLEIIQTEAETPDEMKLNLEELSEEFIVLDLDTFLLEKTSLTDFFEDRKPKIRLYPEKPQRIDIKSQQLYTNYTLINNSSLEIPYILRPGRGPIPMVKAHGTAFEKSPIYPQLRGAPGNVDTECMWGLATGKALEITKDNTTLEYTFSTTTSGIIRYDLLNNLNRRGISISFEINNLKFAHPTAINWLLEGLEYRLGKEKSKFEIYQ